MKRKSIKCITAILSTAIVSVAFCVGAFAGTPPVGLRGRYILSGTVAEVQTFNNGIRTIYVVDEAGEEWAYSYGATEECPSEDQSVILIMNSNGTLDTQLDDTIENVLWARPEECEVD